MIEVKVTFVMPFLGKLPLLVANLITLSLVERVGQKLKVV